MTDTRSPPAIKGISLRRFQHGQAVVQTIFENGPIAMEQNEKLQAMLAEIRDLLQEQLKEYRRVTGEALEIQRHAVRLQEQSARLYKTVLIAVFLVGGAAIWYLGTLLSGR